MNDLFGITSALFLAFVGAELALRFGHSRIIGQLIIGLLLGIPVVQSFLFTESSLHVIDIFSELGIIFLMLLTGLELDIDTFQKNKKDSFVIAILGAIMPFSLGYGIGMFMGFSILTSSILGASLAISAEGITAALLLELKKIKSKVGSILLGAGIIDDLLGILFLSGLLFFLKEGTGVNTLLPVKIAIAIVVLLFAYLSIPKIVRIVECEEKEASLFNVIILIGLVLAISGQLVGLGSIPGAFLAGILLQRSFVSKKHKREESHHLNVFAFAFILPFFFVSTGLHFDFFSIWENPILSLLILCVAMAGKIFGILLAKPFVQLRPKQLYLIGWGMNSRGIMELVLANIALTHGLITQNLYSAIIFMTIVTTLTFPIIFKKMIRKNPGIMD